jgi:hypothetical protein
VKKWLSQNNYPDLNVALVSGGGNDARFANYIQSYYMNPINGFAEDDNEQDLVRSFIDDDIPALYAELGGAFETMRYGTALVTEYPSPVIGADGPCVHPFHPSFSLPPLSSGAEVRAFESVFLSPLNAKIKSTVRSMPKFRYVEGMYNKSLGHGFCSFNPLDSNPPNHYFNTLPESFLLQGDERGYFHPNSYGYNVMYRPFVKKALDEVLDPLIRDGYEKELKAIVQAAKEKAKARIVEETRREVKQESRKNSIEKAVERSRRTARRVVQQALSQCSLRRCTPQMLEQAKQEADTAFKNTLKAELKTFGIVLNKIELKEIDDLTKAFANDSWLPDRPKVLEKSRKYALFRAEVKFDNCNNDDGDNCRSKAIEEYIKVLVENLAAGDVVLSDAEMQEETLAANNLFPTHSMIVDRLKAFQGERDMKLQRERDMKLDLLRQPYAPKMVRTGLPKFKRKVNPEQQQQLQQLRDRAKGMKKPPAILPDNRMEGIIKPSANLMGDLDRRK